VNTEYFSESYPEARQRFVSAAKDKGAEVSSYAIAQSDELTIDVATVGPPTAPTVVITSGVHGVEGYLGSAIQLAWLDRYRASQDSQVKFVLVHAVNPFGFAHDRRWNEDNVDLNRNFLVDQAAYAGASPRYQQLDPLLNPPRPASRFDAFTLKAIFAILRHGMPAIKEAVAGGQYDYPTGLFFGGHGPCESTRLIQDNIESWIGDSPETIHLDFHSGLGDFADYRLLLDQTESDPDCNWYRDVFEATRVEPLSDATGVAYVASGGMGNYLRSRYTDRNYRFVTPEFGTFGPLRVLAALRAENQAHFYHAPTDRAYLAAKETLRECFCPRSIAWREKVLESSLQLIDQAQRGMLP
jgi:hypothetical protein